MFKGIIRIIKWTKNYQKNIYIGFIYSILDSLFSTCPLIVTAYMINRLYLDKSGLTTLTINDVYLSIILILGSIILRYFCAYKRTLLQDNVSYIVSKEDRLKVGEILKRVPLGFFKENKTGEMASVLTTELSFLEMYAMPMIDIVANSYLFIIFVLIFLFTINIKVGLIALISLIISTLALYCINKFLLDKAPIRQKAIADIASATIEYIRGISIIKSYNQQGFASKTYKDAIVSARKINISLEKIYVVPETIHNLALEVGSILILYIVTILMTDNNITIEMWILLSLYSFVMFKGVQGVSSASIIISIVNTSLDNLEKIFDAKYIDANGEDITLNNYDIEFNDVHFSYQNNEVIKGISFKVPEKTNLALVGSSGSGKTTICNLLARFYDVNSGSITLGNHDLREFTCSSLLNNITMVFQNVYLFNDTIRNNIIFSKKDASEEEMINAAKKACCHDFIMQLKDGYDTVISEGGSSLSGGEKQRISIARAMLKDAPIVILDEATASIDPENEYHVQQALTKLTEDKTVITIAHRLKTIEEADQIIVIDDGKIIGQGTHKELINKPGKYQSFMEIRKKAEEWSI